MSVDHATHANGHVRVPHADPDQPLAHAADTAMNHARTGRGAVALADALVPLADDPRGEVRDAAVLIAADVRAALPAESVARVEAMLARSPSARLSPGAAARRMKSLAEAALAEGPGAEAVLRFATAAHRLFRQAYPVTPETVAEVVAGVARLDPAALAGCDQFASDTGPGAGRLAAALLRGPGRTTRPEWKAACDASQTALEVFKRVETKLSPAVPWWRSRPVLIGLAAVVVFGIGLALGAALRRPAEVRQEVVPVVVHVPAPEKPAPPPPKAPPPAPAPASLAGVRKVVIIAPGAMSNSLPGVELAARLEGVIHATGLRDKEKGPSPQAEIVPYLATPAAALVPADYLTDPNVEPVVARLGQHELLGGADHAAVVRPVRMEGGMTVAVVTLIKLAPPPVPPAKDAPAAKVVSAAEVAGVARVWSDVWHLPGEVPVPAARDTRPLRVALAAADTPIRGRLVAEVLARQPNATADDFATAAAFYLAGSAQGSAEAARARELLWAGYSRGRSDDLTRLLVGVERHANRVGLLDSNPNVLIGPDRSVFVEQRLDDSQATVRFEMAQGWATKKLGELIRDPR